MALTPEQDAKLERLRVLFPVLREILMQRDNTSGMAAAVGAAILGISVGTLDGVQSPLLRIAFTFIVLAVVLMPVIHRSALNRNAEHLARQIEIIAGTPRPDSPQDCRDVLLYYASSVLFSALAIGGILLAIWMWLPHE